MGGGRDGGMGGGGGHIQPHTYENSRNRDAAPLPRPPRAPPPARPPLPAPSLTCTPELDDVYVVKGLMVQTLCVSTVCLLCSNAASRFALDLPLHDPSTTTRVPPSFFFNLRGGRLLAYFKNDINLLLSVQHASYVCSCYTCFEYGKSVYALPLK